MLKSKEAQDSHILKYVFVGLQPGPGSSGRLGLSSRAAISLWFGNMSTLLHGTVKS